MIIKQKNTNQSGFTLIELLVVIFIIGILAGLLITNFVGVRSRAADTRLKNDLNQMKTALRLYYNDYQRYPSSSIGRMLGCGTAGTAICAEGGTFSAGNPSTVYMQELPEAFTYAVGASNESFTISTSLENPSDQDIEASADRCGQTYTPGSTTYYVCSN